MALLWWPRCESRVVLILLHILLLFLLLTRGCWGLPDSSSSSSSSSQCDSASSQSCSLAGTFCQWTHQGGWVSASDHVIVDPKSSPNGSATLLSPLLCSTTGPKGHCLTFHHSTFDDTPGGTLSVILLKEQQGEDGTVVESALWSVEASNDSIDLGKAAAVSVDSGGAEFRLGFRAAWGQGQYPVISLRNVSYVRASCDGDGPSSSDPSPSSSAPSPSSSDPSPSSSAPSPSRSRLCCVCGLVMMVMMAVVAV